MFRLASPLLAGLASGSRISAPPCVSPLMSLMAVRFKHEFAPRFKRIRKSMKGRVGARVGGSLKGNSLEFGQFGLRLKSNGIRMTATQLKEAHNVIMREIRPSGADLLTRFSCDLAVCVKGNQTRMGKGKGAFSHWATRVRTGKILFEIRGNLHERVAKEALRKASAKLPGVCEIVTEKSLIRVSPTKLVEKPAPVDYLELLNARPTKKWANIVASKQPLYKQFRGR
ncbi:39S ribosomal protein L16, mitochondrial [Yamadazyma tenuis]|uniref:Uncharacterized protein n=1 Tax=Candida tenuis (strain ATCC 10573 / BCRC 21748 / CBS 615 / JCM 9827 / NBRC 10315 / NRRL Y-1498 / VKM Y-70) TaxID=590646 RepID=G3BC70_CANTC|nr:uncharacterized protein CANTEDRAFT_116157 [Yamadazyma tenuis ATCC 10573]XP_006690234.1 uncharacterized protein CANTEDRAFT_116157 [Yamadazyma tenuis ATCC 10573]EGV61019.1 hypothetical protein CANTEDRAFT_116157 [Yamadazyma tenuis ATCC 10573]EGV61020.1 hypothetical protein CANTEDRAFT_116157 [Yamadazyma tenuis ATCC 10573]WEJ94633.1 39S ribosomal protein L16, mitochondrial [Yamadazyma tenuis]